MLQWQLEMIVEAEPFNDYRYVFQQFGGLQVGLVNFLSQTHPIRNRRDIENYLARLELVAAQMDEGDGPGEGQGQPRLRDAEVDHPSPRSPSSTVSSPTTGARQRARQLARRTRRQAPGRVRRRIVQSSSRAPKRPWPAPSSPPSSAPRRCCRRSCPLPTRPSASRACKAATGPTPRRLRQSARRPDYTPAEIHAIGLTRSRAHRGRDGRPTSPARLHGRLRGGARRASSTPTSSRPPNPIPAPPSCARYDEILARRRTTRVGVSSSCGPGRRAS